MFIGRTKELIALEDVYNKKGFGMTVIYGRRRIGKSTLIREFVKGKKTIFYTATKVNADRNLELFSAQVISVFIPFDQVNGQVSDRRPLNGIACIDQKNMVIQSFDLLFV